MVEINIPLGDVRRQLIKNNSGVIRHMPDQGVCYKGDPHAVTGKMIGRDLLVQLQRHMGRKTCAF